MPESPTDPADWPTLEVVVRRHVLATCERCGWNLKAAAEALGLCEKSVYNHLHRYAGQGFLEHGGVGKWRIKTGG